MELKRLILLTLLGLTTLTSSISAVEDEDDSEEVTVEVEDAEDVPYTSPVPKGNYYFAENFDDPALFKKKWMISEAKKEGLDDAIAKYDGVWEMQAPQRDGLRGDQGLVLKSKAKHAAISARLNRPFYFNDKPLVVQYEVLLQEGQECGGSYLKLLSLDNSGNDLRTFQDKTPYSIMFGPDKCGNDHKLHFIFRHKNPLNGSITEKHCQKPKDRLEEPFKDKQPHLYTLILRPDNTFLIIVDHKIVKEGSLLEDFSPEVNPPTEIDDPNDMKPADWDETEKIPDPDAHKPQDWDESAPAQIPDPTATKPSGWLDDEPDMIPDPNAEKPSDWDTEMDGDWEAPLIPNPLCEKAAGCGKWSAPLINNPEYKGKWHAPLIANPNYKGRWKPRRVPNPDFFEDKHPFRMTPIAAVGFELWSMSNMILFDNILITDDPSVAAQYAADSFDLKRKKLDKSSESFVSRIINYSNENPWLYAVYIVAVGLPVVLFIVFCCSSSESDEQKKAALAKKTDEDLPDDMPDEQEQDFEQDEGNENEAGSLNDGDESETGTTTTTSTTRSSKSQLDLQEDEVVPAYQGVEGSGDAPRSPKKRRARKD